MEVYINLLVKINLTLYLLSFVGIIYCWYKTKSLYFIPISLYLINVTILYFTQLVNYIPSADVARIWSMCSRLYEIIIILGSIIIYYKEKHTIKG